MTILERLQAGWQTWEQWWRVAPTPANAWSPQKTVSWGLALTSVVLALTASYLAARLQLVEAGGV